MLQYMRAVTGITRALAKIKARPPFLYDEEAKRLNAVENHERNPEMKEIQNEIEEVWHRKSKT